MYEFADLLTKTGHAYGNIINNGDDVMDYHPDAFPVAALLSSVFIIIIIISVQLCGASTIQVRVNDLLRLLLRKNVKKEACLGLFL